MTGDAIIKTMDLVRRFSFEHGILGQGASSADVVGIQFPAGKSLGDAAQHEDALRPGIHQTGPGRAVVTGQRCAVSSISIPTKGGALFLSVLPFILLISVYLAASNARLTANPGDKLLPSPATLAAHHASLCLRGRRAQRRYPVLG